MDREELLRNPLVAVFAVVRPDGRVHATPLWFHWSVTAGPAAVCIETVDPAGTSFVTAEGPVTVVDPLTKEARFRLWERYRGAHHAREVVDAGGHESKVLLLLRPETWIPA